MKPLLLLVLVLVPVACATSARPLTPSAEPPIVRERWCMGTRLRVVVHGPAEAVEAALDEADRWDALLSHFRPDSALAAVNRNAGRAVRVPAELGRFLRAAVAIAERTESAFDPTVGPLVEAHRSGAGAGEIQAERQHVGWRDIVIRSDEDIALSRPGMRLDPSAIGKGWAVDAMVAELRHLGIRSAFVDFGESSFYGLGVPPGADGWNVLLKNERGQPEGPVVSLLDTALSTSMTQVWDEVSKTLRPHIFDPRNGHLVTTPRFVAVVSPSATDADALSTALAVVGKEGVAILGQFPGASAWIDEAGADSTLHGSFPLQSRSRDSTFPP